MIVVYAYRYGIVGGVSTQLLLRQSALRELGVRCILYFSQDNGLRQLVQSDCDLHFGSSMSFGRLIASEKPDVVVVVDTPELVRSGGRRPFRRPAVYLDVHTTTGTGLAYLRMVNVSRLAGVMVPSQYSQGILSSRLTGVRVSVVPNILNTGTFVPCNASAGRWCGPREFIWVGKLDNHKNWRLAMVYTRLLVDLFGRVRMTFVGGYSAPPERTEAFFELADRLGVVPHIRWLDRIDNCDMASLYQQCAASGGAMVVTSRDESFGMAAGEALLCGCPLIANDLQVFKEVLPRTALVRLVDIWKPDQVIAAARTLDHAVSAPEVESVVAQLKARFGPEAYAQRFLAAVGR